MKLKLLILPFCIIVLNAFGFEGTIKQTVKNYNGTGTDISMIWYFGANKCKLEMAASGKSINSHTVIILDPQAKNLKTYEAGGTGAKVYYQIDAATISNGLNILSSTPTQETKQINGYKCEKWIVVSSIGAYNVWVAKDVDIDWAGYKDLMKTSVEIQALAGAGVKGFPMLTEAIGSNSTSTVESVTVKSQTSETFAIPAEYTVYTAAVAPAATTPASKKK